MRLAARLRDAHDVDAETGGTSLSDKGAGGPAARERALGARQAAVLSLSGLDAELGLAARDVADALGLAPPNATNLLKRLEGHGKLTRVPDERPARWRRPDARQGA